MLFKHLITEENLLVIRLTILISENNFHIGLSTLKMVLMAANSSHRRLVAFQSHCQLKNEFI